MSAGTGPDRSHAPPDTRPDRTGRTVLLARSWYSWWPVWSRPGLRGPAVRVRGGRPVLPPGDRGPGPGGHRRTVAAVGPGLTPVRCPPPTTATGRGAPTGGWWTDGPGAADATRRRSGASGSPSCIWPGRWLWRIPPSVNALARHPWLVAVEAVTLVAVGVGPLAGAGGVPAVATPAVPTPPGGAGRGVHVDHLGAGLPGGAVPRLVVSRLRPPPRGRAQPLRRPAADHRDDVVRLGVRLHPGGVLEPGPLAAVRGGPRRGAAPADPRGADPGPHREGGPAPGPRVSSVPV